MAIQQFYTPKKLYTPQNKFLATPLVSRAEYEVQYKVPMMMCIT